MQMHFMSGLPRSGSTLLAAILLQNPQIRTSIISPLAAMYNAIMRSSSGEQETANFVSEEDRERILRAVFSAYYTGFDGTVIDNNRSWTTKMAGLAKLFPDFRMVCCVRQPAWIMDSVEKLLRKSPTTLTGLLGYAAGTTVYDRADMLAGSDGMLGWALNGLREAYFGPHADRMMLVEYDALVQSPERVVREVYNWLSIPHFKHDFNNIDPVPGANAFDMRLSTPGLHDVGRVVRKDARKTCLPPDVFARFAPPFWRDQRGRGKVILGH